MQLNARLRLTDCILEEMELFTGLGSSHSLAPAGLWQWRLDKSSDGALCRPNVEVSNSASDEFMQIGFASRLCPLARHATSSMPMPSLWRFLVCLLVMVSAGMKRSDECALFVKWRWVCLLALVTSDKLAECEAEELCWNAA